jgi:hypothetical protein
MIILGNNLRELFSLNRAPRVLMGFEKHVTDYFSNKLILFLKIKIKSNFYSTDTSDQRRVQYVSVSDTDTTPTHMTTFNYIINFFQIITGVDVFVVSISSY